MSLMEIHPIRIERPGTPIKVKGRVTKTIAVTLTGNAHIQPLDFSSTGSEQIHILPQGNNDVRLAKMYYYGDVQKNDIVTDVETGEKFVVLQVFHYERMRLSLSHKKVYLQREED